VGASVGYRVGAGVGDAVGSAVVGVGVGKGVGDKVGGMGVGSAVGTAVGSGVGTTTTLPEDEGLCLKPPEDAYAPPPIAPATATRHTNPKKSREDDEHRFFVL
jgi:hypothetical protein